MSVERENPLSGVFKGFFLLRFAAVTLSRASLPSLPSVHWLPSRWRSLSHHWQPCASATVLLRRPSLGPKLAPTTLSRTPFASMTFSPAITGFGDSFLSQLSSPLVVFSAFSSLVMLFEGVYSRRRASSSKVKLSPATLLFGDVSTALTVVDVHPVTSVLDSFPAMSVPPTGAVSYKEVLSSPFTKASLSPPSYLSIPPLPSLLGPPPSFSNHLFPLLPPKKPSTSSSLFPPKISLVLPHLSSPKKPYVSSSPSTPQSSPLQNVSSNPNVASKVDCSFLFLSSQQ